MLCAAARSAMVQPTIAAIASADVPLLRIVIAIRRGERREVERIASDPSPGSEVVVDRQAKHSVNKLARAHRSHEIFLALDAERLGQARSSEQLGQPEPQAEPAEGSAKTINGFD